MIALKPFQMECLRALDQNHHVLGIATTGAGKSLVFELTVRNGNHRAVLVTPLLALGRQQAVRFEEIQIPVRFGISAGPPEGTGPAVWILSPESLTGRTMAMLKKWNPDFLIVDECHCIQDWGQDFRPAFRNVFEILSVLAFRKTLWLSATVSSETVGAISKEIKARLNSGLFVIGAFGLPDGLSIKTARIPLVQRPMAVAEYALTHAEPGIVFSQTRDGAERLMRILRAAGVESLLYHAGLSDEERRAQEARLRGGDKIVVVATSAFGLGMNFPQLRWCLLAQAPPSFLFLAQAFGRAGRSGESASAICLWDHDDFRLLEWMFAGRSDVRAAATKVWKALDAGVDLRIALEAEFKINDSTYCKCPPPQEPRTAK